MSVFDSPWFAFEKPIYNQVAKAGNVPLTFMLIALAIICVVIATLPKEYFLLKVAFFTYMVAP